MSKFAQHIRRFGWIYPIVIVLIAWPSALATTHQLPPLDAATLTEAMAWQDAELERKYGPPLHEEFVKAWTEDRLHRRFMDDPRVRRLGGNEWHSDHLWQLAGQPWATELASIERDYGAVLEKWAAMDTRGSAGRRWGDLVNATYTTEFENLQIQYGRWRADISIGWGLARRRSVVHKAKLARATSQEDWNEAFRQFEILANIWKPLRSSSGRSDIRFDVLLTEYEALSHIIDAKPPIEIRRRVLGRLTEMLIERSRFDWPAYPTFAAALSANRGVLYKSPSGFFNSPWHLRGAMANGFAMSPSFSEGPLKAWMDHYRRDVDYYYAYIGFYGQPSWTNWAMWKTWLTEAALSEPALLEHHGLPAELQEKLDPWTLAVSIQREDFWFRNRGRPISLLTHIELLRVTVASQLYKRDKGEWPKTLESLHPDYLDPLPTGQIIAPKTNWYSGGPIAASMPIRMGWIEVDEDMRDELWQHFLPGCSGVDEDGMLNTKGIRFLGSGKTWDSGEPIRAAYHAADRLAHPAFVESYEVLQWKAKRGQPGKWEPLDYDLARQTTDAFDAYKIEDNATGQKSEQLDLSGLATPILNVRFKGKLRAPERVFAIWSPGLDGDDDEGRDLVSRNIFWDARGDIVVFPEGL